MEKRREIFIEHYIKTKNATQSAIEAGYAVKSARVTGHRLVTNDNISKRIELRFKELEAEYKLSRDDYIKKTIILHNEAKHPSTKQRYWDLLGKVLGYNKDTTIEISTFAPPPIVYNQIKITKQDISISKQPEDAHSGTNRDKDIAKVRESQAQ